MSHIEKILCRLPASSDIVEHNAVKLFERRADPVDKHQRPRKRPNDLLAIVLRSTRDGPYQSVNPVLSQHIQIGSLDCDLSGPRFDEGAEVTPESLVEKRLIKNTKTDVKLLGTGEVSKKLTVRVHAISASARGVERPGGTVELLRAPKVKKARHHSKAVAATEDETEAPGAAEETEAEE